MSIKNGSRVRLRTDDKGTPLVVACMPAVVNGLEMLGWLQARWEDDDRGRKRNVLVAVDAVTELSS